MIVHLLAAGPHTIELALSGACEPPSPPPAFIRSSATNDISIFACKTHKRPFRVTLDTTMYEMWKTWKLRDSFILNWAFADAKNSGCCPNSPQARCIYDCLYKISLQVLSGRFTNSLTLLSVYIIYSIYSIRPCKRYAWAKGKMKIP